jgi:hypothetical protein
MILSTLAVIVLIATQLLIYNQNSRSQTFKVEGRHIIRLLSSLTFDQLVPAQAVVIF